MNKVILTPETERTINLLKECAATESIGVVVGANGTGKTSALKYAAKKYSWLGLKGKCLLVRCCQNAGPTRGVRDIIEEMGCREILFRAGASLQVLVKHSLAEFKKRDIRALILDEADLWAHDTLRGVISLVDFCKENDYPIALILAGVKHPDRWIGTVAAGLSRTLRVEEFANLSAEDCMSVMQVWSPMFKKLVAKIEKGNASANEIGRLVYKVTGGNMRRMKFFAELLLLEKEPEIDKKLAQKISDKLLKIE